jgi:nucleoside-diphosphate-sugar epimerase
VKVLLTGASGFIGRYALDVLTHAGHEVHAVSRHAQALPGGAIGHEADLLRPGAAETLVRQVRPTHLLHLAWYALPGSFWSAPENELWIDASLRLVRAFGEAGGQRAVIAGTCAEYAWGEPLLREQLTPLEPATLYGASKHAAHIAAEAVARELGVSLAWGRIFFLYGPGEHPARLVCGVARGLLAGEQVPTTDGYQLRDFMHVRDVASAFVALLGGGVSGAVNVASGKGLPVRDLVTLIAEETGGIERVRFGELAPRPNDPAIIVADVDRLHTDVGFAPAIDLRAGIAETVAWLRDRG